MGREERVQGSGVRRQGPSRKTSAAAVDRHLSEFVYLVATSVADRCRCYPLNDSIICLVYSPVQALQRLTMLPSKKSFEVFGSSKGPSS